VLGCKHYQQKCRLLAPCCQRWYTCRLCHDADADHEVDRYAYTTMCCMLCGTVQPVGPACTHCNASVRLQYDRGKGAGAAHVCISVFVCQCVCHCVGVSW
jgi:hypothetical protein